MTAHFDLEALEGAVLASPVHERGPLSDAARGVLHDPHTALANPTQNDGAQTSEAQATVLETELVTEGEWFEQWASMHDMAGGLVQMRTGQHCPLGEQARNEGGRIAAQAAYSLLNSNPTLARLVLGAKSTFYGQIVAIGMHGASCIGIIRASTSKAIAKDGPEFKHREVKA